MEQNKKAALLLIFIGLYLIGSALINDGAFLSRGLVNWGLWMAITTFLLGPFVWICNQRNPGISGRKSLTLLCLAGVILLINLLLLLSPRLWWFANLHWNWQGKLISLAAALVFVQLWFGQSWEKMGFTLPRPGSWVRIISILAGAAVFFAVGSSGNPGSIDFETVLFQASMPGFEEELIFRGILWMLIEQTLPGTRKLWNANAGWNLIITTFIFALVHGVTFDNDFSLIINPSSLISTGAAGFVMGWIRAYSRSILPSVVLHNGINLLAYIVPQIMN